MIRKAFVAIISTFLIVLAVLTVRPVPIPNEKDCLIVKGRVIEINEDGVKDIVFRLVGLNQTYYVNRGLERGLELEKLRAELIDKEITIKYPQYWSPFGNSSKHISKLEFSGRTIFREID